MAAHPRAENVRLHRAAQRGRQRVTPLEKLAVHGAKGLFILNIADEKRGFLVDDPVSNICANAKAISPRRLRDQLISLQREQNSPFSANRFNR